MYILHSAKLSVCACVCSGVCQLRLIIFYFSESSDRATGCSDSVQEKQKKSGKKTHNSDNKSTKQQTYESAALTKSKKGEEVDQQIANGKFSRHKKCIEHIATNQLNQFYSSFDKMLPLKKMIRCCGTRAEEA